MNRYLLIYRTPNDMPDYEPSPEEMQAQMKQWTDWKEQFTDQILDLGDGLKPGGRILQDDQVSDGPYTEVKEVVGGYSIVQAADYDGALTVARACPIMFMPGASIEVRELAGY